MFVMLRCYVVLTERCLRKYSYLVIQCMCNIGLVAILDTILDVSVQPPVLYTIDYIGEHFDYYDNRMTTLHVFLS